MENKMNNQEYTRRRKLVEQARALITRTLPVEDADDFSLRAWHSGFYLQIVFSELHPFIVFYLARTLDRPGYRVDAWFINGLNLNGILGSHAVNAEMDCYSFRTAHWLDTELTAERFQEILERAVDEASHAYYQLTQLEGNK